MDLFTLFAIASNELGVDSSTINIILAASTLFVIGLPLLFVMKEICLHLLPPSKIVFLIRSLRHLGMWNGLDYPCFYSDDLKSEAIGWKIEILFSPKHM